jgi:hypothetical protein
MLNLLGHLKACQWHGARPTCPSSAALEGASSLATSESTGTVQPVAPAFPGRARAGPTGSLSSVAWSWQAPPKPGSRGCARAGMQRTARRFQLASLGAAPCRARVRIIRHRYRVRDWPACWAIRKLQPQLEGGQMRVILSAPSRSLRGSQEPHRDRGAIPAATGAWTPSQFFLLLSAFK